VAHELLLHRNGSSHRVKPALVGMSHAVGADLSLSEDVPGFGSMKSFSPLNPTRRTVC
jgi:hypothetical protein